MRDGWAASCRDGDVACDADAAADGVCTFAASLCLNVRDPAIPECEPATLGPVHAGGRGASAIAIAAAAAAIHFPVSAADVCTAEAPVRVRLGRRSRRTVVLRARARDLASGRAARAALHLTCARGAALGAEPARAIVVTTDFETGLLATVGVARPHSVGRPTSPIHADAVVRTFGDRVYVVNRFLGDNLQVLDPARGLATVVQCSTGPGSNPHDVAVVGPHKAYVTRFDRPELWIVDPDPPSCAGFFLGQIDLGAFADADGLPEMDQMTLVADRLFVSLERLDRRRDFAPAGKSLLVAIDTATDAVVGTVELSGGNAFGESAGLVHEPRTGKLVVAEAGSIFRTGDGGLERIDPFALRAEGFFVTEDDLGGNVTDFVLVSPTKGYAVVIDDALHNVLLAFDPSRHAVTRRLLVRREFLPEIDLAPDGTLWLADRGLPAPGIRIFDVASDRPLTRGAIDVGLPPFAMAFVP
ncbi:MAG: hypothetical protein E6J79_03905 [Deltaproteobacteria bacterium]|nr:MAG: hypothetical protein E6J79_03905 [Deltaproteobacteria bacterium]